MAPQEPSIQFHPPYRRRSQVLRRRGVGSAILIALVGAAMVTWTWNGWPDPLVDFGRELYVPWQLSQGKTLYRDIAYFNGPLSAYFNAALFLMFGVSLRTLVIANIVIAVFAITLIWRLWRRAAGQLSATIACLLFVMLFLPLQLVEIGNYNWICPYSHELTHGLTLGLLSLELLAWFLARPRARHAAAAGFTVGLVCLTKPEVFVAIAPTVTVGLVLAVRVRRLSARAATRAIASFAMAGLAAPLLAMLLLSLRMPIALACRGTMGGWAYLFDSSLLQLPFYRHIAGTDDFAANVARAILQSLGYAALFAVPVLLGLAFGKQRRRPELSLICAAGAVIALIALYRWIAWQEAFHGLSLITLLIALMQLSRALRRRAGPRAVPRATMSLLALLLLLKMFWAVRLYHYGFALAMPAALVAAAALVGWLPQWIKRRGGDGNPLRLSALAAISAVVAIYLSAYARFYWQKPIEVAAGTHDVFYSDARGALVNTLVEGLSNFPPSTTVAVLPQGAMVNYLARRENPTRYITVMPPEVRMFGDDAIAADYQAHSPDVLVILPTDFQEYGYGSFDEMAPQTVRWLRANYTVAQILTSNGVPSATILLKN